MDFARVLSDSQIEQFNRAAERLLETTGFRVQDDAALACCAKAGARVDRAAGVVHFAPALLNELLAQAPSAYTISGADGRKYDVGRGDPWGLAIVTDPWIIDADTHEPRRPRLEDLRRHTIIAQSMERVAAVSRMEFPVTDVPEPVSNLRAWQEHLTHFGKHYCFVPAEPETCRRWRDIVTIVAQGRDPAAARFFTLMVAVISPLAISQINVDLLRMAIEYGAPVQPTICPMAGSTAPYSLAGTLLLGHAENLATAALIQVLRPGHPFIYALGPSVTDLRTSHDLYYTLDKVLWKIGAVQLAKSRSLPAVAECGGAMSPRYDVQCGVEGFSFMLAALSSGADMLAGFGSCYTAMGMSAEFMLIQEAYLDAARFLRRGIPTDEQRLAVANIERVGPGGEFLTDDLTLEFMHGSEFFSHPLFDHTPCGETGRTMLERARERADAVVAAYDPPLPGNVREQLDRYFHDECARLESA